MSVDFKVLWRPINPDCYEYDPKNFVFVPGRAVQARLNAATKGDWGVTSEVWSEFPMPSSKGYNGGEGKKCRGLEVTVMLSIGTLGPFPGCGQGNWYEGSDRDTTKRGAYTAAIRSAAACAGVGLELYPECAIEHWLNWLMLLETQEEWQEAWELLNRVGEWIDGPHATPEFRSVWDGGLEFLRGFLEVKLTGVGDWSRAKWPKPGGTSLPPRRDSGAQQRPRQEERPRDPEREERHAQSRSANPNAALWEGVDWSRAKEADRKGFCVLCQRGIKEGDLSCFSANPHHVAGSDDPSEKFKWINCHADCAPAKGGPARKPQKPDNQYDDGGQVDADDDPFA